MAKNRFYYNKVLWAYANNITVGVDSTHFVPNNNCTRCTRGQVVSFLYRNYGE